MGQTVQKRASGVTILELLCVVGIIGVMASLMLPPIGKALRKARGLGEHLGGSGGIEMRIDEVKTNYARYRAANPAHGRLSRTAFIRELKLSPKAEAWLTLSSVEYRPFASTDPIKQTAIIVHPSEGGGSGINLVVFRIGDLIGE